MNLLKTEIIQNVLYLELNRPEVFNSFNKEMAFDLQNALNSGDKDENVRVIVIKGNGKAFCAGQDLSEAIAHDGPTLEEIVRQHYNPIIQKIRMSSKPIIAAVNGVAAGAGANIALACDIVVAKKSASFIQAFSKIGLIPDSGGTFFLPRLIGQQKALALMLTGDKVTADEAEKLNMIFKSIDDEIFEQEIKVLAEKLALMPTQAFNLTKQAFNQSWSNNLDQQLNLEAVLQVAASETYDFKEGVDAFLNKRSPVFIGK